jgi:hypothetical protein
MEINKFNKVYSKKSVSDLLEQLLNHRITGSTLEKEWYEALKIHLTQREIKQEERRLFEKILDSAPEVLKKEIQQIKIEILSTKEELSIAKSRNLVIEPLNIKSAGRSIKNVVYSTLIITLLAVVAFLTVSSSKDLETVKSIFILIGLLSFACNIFILFQLYSAGDNLEKSVKEIEEK